MKAKTFESLIRKIVREEIDYALRREIKSLKEDLRGDTKPQITEQSNNTPIPESKKNTLREKIMGTNPIIDQTPTHNFAKNEALNELLNETARGNTNTQSAMDSVNLSQPFSSGDPLPMDTTAMPESVANAVTRDYSDLMEAINKKKK